MRTLAINRNYMPLRLVSAHEAVCKCYTGNAAAITFEGEVLIELSFAEWLARSATNDWPSDQVFLHGSTYRVAVPRTIRYLHYDKLPRTTLRLSRRGVYRRDGYVCYLCGEEFSESKLSVDHVVPISRGGKTTWENLATCCKLCNFKKGDKLLSELKQKPFFMPHSPTVSNIARLKLESPTDYEEWKHFGV